MSGSSEGVRLTPDTIVWIESHMTRAGIPDRFRVDMRHEDGQLWSLIKSFFVPFGPNHMFNSDRLPVDPIAKNQRQKLQQEWGTGPDSFLAAVGVPRGTAEFNLEWAMVRREDIEKTPEELVKSIERARDFLNDYQIRSLELVYAATTGAWPEGSSHTAPVLQELPAVRSF